MAAAKSGQKEVIKILLKDGRFDPSINSNQALNEACNNDQLEIVRFLLNDSRVKIGNFHQGYSGELESACKNGEINLVERLLNHCQAQIEYHGEYLTLAAMNGHGDVVKLLLKDGNFNPATRSNLAIKIASQGGYPDAVALLLADPRVDPAAECNFALIEAAKNGHSQVVKLLLANSKVDPEAQSNLAIKEAVKNKHLEVVKLLLVEPRINTAVKEEIIRSANFVTLVSSRFFREVSTLMEVKQGRENMYTPQK